MSSNVSIIGAGGLLGKSLEKILREQKIQSKKISSTNTKLNLDLNLNFSSDYLEELIEGSDGVVILSTIKGSHFKNQSDLWRQFNVNVINMYKLIENLLELNKKIVYVSGAIVYRFPNLTKINEHSTIGYSGLGGSYGLTKYLLEKLLIKNKLQTYLTILRPSSIYGQSNSRNDIFSKLMAEAKERKNIRLVSPINTRFGLVSEDDVSRAIIHVLKNKLEDVYNVSSYENYDLLQISMLIKEMLDIKIYVEDMEQKKVESQEIKKRYDLDIRKIVNTGWVPKNTLIQSLHQLAKN